LNRAKRAGIPAVESIIAGHEIVLGSEIKASGFFTRNDGWDDSVRLRKKVRIDPKRPSFPGDGFSRETDDSLQFKALLIFRAVKADDLAAFWGSPYKGERTDKNSGASRERGFHAGSGDVELTGDQPMGLI
jgi:hypothetical protein